MKNYIYILVGDDDEIRYVGKTMYPKQRLYSHIKESKGVRNNHKINWIKKLLSENKKPKMVLIDEVDEDWQYWEKYWIEQFKQWGFNLTNLTDGGDGGQGYKHTDLTKDKIRKSKLGKPLSKEHKIKISESVKEDWENNPREVEKDIIISKEELYQKYIIDNLSIPKLSKLFGCSESTIFRNLKDNNISKDIDVWRDQLVTNQKVVLQYDLSGNFIREFDSVISISDEYGYNSGNIASCCRGVAVSANGYIWRYKDEFLEIDLERLNYQKRKIKQYDLKGNLIKSYDSIKDAASFGFNEGNIQDCCVYRLKSHRGFIWRYIEDDNPVVYESKNKRYVLQYDMSGNFIKEWDSIANACKELKIGSNCITTCCKGKYKSSGGYIWKYKSDIK